MNCPKKNRYAPLQLQNSSFYHDYHRNEEGEAMLQTRDKFDYEALLRIGLTEPTNQVKALELGFPNRSGQENGVRCHPEPGNGLYTINGIETSIDSTGNSCTGSSTSSGSRNGTSK